MPLVGQTKLEGIIIAPDIHCLTYSSPQRSQSPFHLHRMRPLFNQQFSALRHSAILKLISWVV